MKRIMLIAMALVLAVCGTVYADQTAIRTYDLSLSTAETGTTDTYGTYVSGASTSPGGGVSEFILSGEDMKRDDGISTIKNVRYLSSGNGVLWIKSLTTTQAQQARGGYYSGATFYVAVRAIPPGGSWASAELVPISPVMSMDGVTRYSIPFRLQVGSEHKIYFVTSGLTGFDQALGTCMIGFPEAGWPDPAAFVIADATMPMTAGQSGVSTIAQIFGGSIPQGARYVSVRVQSGGSVYYTADGKTTPVSTGVSPVGTDVSLGSAIETTSIAARNVKIDVGAANVNLHAQAWNLDPWK